MADQLPTVTGDGGAIEAQPVVIFKDIDHGGGALDWSTISGGGGGGTGDASAANQTTQITSANLTNTTLGAVTASPTANTIGDRLKTINTTLGTPLQAGGTVVVTGVATAANQTSTNTKLDTLHTDLAAATPAGENHIGAVGGHSAVVGGSFTRPADTTAYAIGDLVANSTTAGSVTPISCAVARINAGSGVIRRARLSTSKTGLAGTEAFRVHLFKTSPTVTNGDNGVLSVNGVTSIALGYVDITMSSVYNDGAKGFTATDIVFEAGAATTNIYALIEARAAYTPASGETLTLALETYRD